MTSNSQAKFKLEKSSECFYELKREKIGVYKAVDLCCLSRKGNHMRYIWKGTISFGLINVPVGLVSAARDHELKFTLLHKKDFSEIRYARICKEEDKEVPYTEIVRGIQRGGQYKVLSPEDFKDAEGEKSKIISIATFCDASEVDALYYEKPYFLKADKDADKAYFLLHRALQETNKVAIAQYIFKNHTHIAVIKPYKNILTLNQMRYQSQIINVEKLEISEKVKLPAKEVEMAKKLIEQLSGHFNPEEYHDRYVEDLEKKINTKGKSAKIKIQEKTKKTGKVYDLMDLLKASLEQEKPQVKKKSVRK